MPPAPQCPRCAYDLSGLVESWSSSCPLRGLCSECGLAFDWPNVLNPSRRLPAWSFEHAPRERRPAAFIGTLRRAMWPPTLWRALSLEMPIVPGRLCLFALCAIFLLKLVGTAALGPLVALAWRRSSPWSRAEYLAVDLVWPYDEFAGSWSIGYVAPWVVIGALTIVLVPFAYFILPVSLRRAKVRPRHIFRIQAYSLAIAPLTLGVWSLLRAAYLWAEVYSPYTLYDLYWLLDGDTHRTAGLAALAWTLALLLLGWSAATRHYLRLPHSGTVALAVVTIAVLAAAVMVVLTCGHRLF